MAPARRRGTLGNLAGHQRGEAADPMESWSPGRLPWVELEQTSPPVRSAMAGTVSPSFRVPAARGRRSAVHLGAVVGDVQTGHGAPLPPRPYRVATPMPLRNRAGQREP